MVSPLMRAVDPPAVYTKRSIPERYAQRIRVRRVAAGSGSAYRPDPPRRRGRVACSFCHVAELPGASWVPTRRMGR